ncbi:MAG: molybdopterin-synthase adenylyltransferase MoeB [Saprospiraceae bacterium]|nr:molybdopterin-synthase adenylyltransferase MoeB [Saprospiraceae bacterium]
MENLPDLNPAEMARYARHIAIPEFDVAGQRKLKAAKVLVAGAGGLGSPLLLYLAAAGIGHIGIVDFDVVDDSNLQRQVLFDTDDIGKPKAERARSKLLTLNPHIDVVAYPFRLSSDNALDIMADYDIVADGTDNFPTRYLVNDACVLAGKTNVYASIFRFEGQVAVFNHVRGDGKRGPNYRHLFPEPPPAGLVPNCAEAGVLGVLPGIIGSMQASEIIKLITGIGVPLNGKLFLFDAASFTSRILNVPGDKEVKIERLIDYETFCGVSKPDQSRPVKEIGVAELKRMMDAGEDFQLIDVREPYEYEIANLKGELIPMSSIPAYKGRISKNKKVIVHCRSGKRSADVIRELESRGAYDNLYNLKGGILAWADEIDPTVQKY